LFPGKSGLGSMGGAFNPAERVGLPEKIKVLA
jgi:hypothetical protein